ncbi:beta-glucosidase [Allosphingosinicella indica]|uniref:Beta-glucosidase n=1 Tax=Allosphingosinicella indica TaxID=941907 RepID=A0A1X7FYR3_9SPHN|nr:beta-glucosidase [Allosphingosinicella indica]SMF61221.1 hypothetical protein SAMN06295910_0203 [Allosphingosinicella indica]
MSNAAPPFASYYMAGFEAASHRRRDGRRLDLIRATAHDSHVRSDYAQCREAGLGTIRDALRWHLIDASADRRDWSSWLPMLEAGVAEGVQVIWTLFHYGTPDRLDPMAPDFPAAFADYARAAAQLQRSVTGQSGLFCPINEMSFFAWAVGKRYFLSASRTSGAAFKRQLVLAAIAAARAIRDADPDSHILWAEPLVHIAPRDRSSQEVRSAERRRLAQFEAADMLLGVTHPELGGRPDLADWLGLNFYPHNQWYYRGATIPLGHHEYRPLADMLVEAQARYAKPLLIAETGAEGSARPAWLHYVCDEVREARRRGARVEGICLYPVTAYPGWDNERHAEAGLFSSIMSDGRRRLYGPLAEELSRQALSG